MTNNMMSRIREEDSDVVSNGSSKRTRRSNSSMQSLLPLAAACPQRPAPPGPSNGREEGSYDTRSIAKVEGSPEGLPWLQDSASVATGLGDAAAAAALDALEVLRRRHEQGQPVFRLPGDSLAAVASTSADPQARTSNEVEADLTGIQMMDGNDETGSNGEDCGDAQETLAARLKSPQEQVSSLLPHGAQVSTPSQTAQDCAAGGSATSDQLVPERDHATAPSQTRCSTQLWGDLDVVDDGSQARMRSGASRHQDTPEFVASEESLQSRQDELPASSHDAWRAAMLQSVESFATGPRQCAPPQNGLKHTQRVFKYFADLKNCHVYQLSPRPPMSASWKDVVDHRRKEESLRGFVSEDALRPIAPPFSMVRLEDTAIQAASQYASPLAKEAASAGRVYGLPFAVDFEHAPIVGRDDTNVTIRDSNGRTILQRLSPTSRRQSLKFGTDWASEGRGHFDALFARQPHAHSIRCGAWFDYARRYGWTQEHANLRPESDDALRWIWNYFHAHITTLACFLENDFLENLRARDSDFNLQREALDKSQVDFFHPWWTLATVTRGDMDVETNHASDKQPSILFGLEQPFLLYIAHSEGFFKTVVRPGQIVFFGSHHLHQIHPLVATGVEQRPRYVVSLAMRRNVVYGDLEPAGARQRLRDPPRRRAQDREIRISYGGTGRGRRHRLDVARSSGSSDDDDDDGPHPQRLGDPNAPELSIVAGRKAWEQGLGGDADKGEE